MLSWHTGHLTIAPYGPFAHGRTISIYGTDIFHALCFFSPVDQSKGAKEAFDPTTDLLSVFRSVGNYNGSIFLKASRNLPSFFPRLPGR